MEESMYMELTEVGFMDLLRECGISGDGDALSGENLRTYQFGFFFNEIPKLYFKKEAFNGHMKLHLYLKEKTTKTSKEMETVILYDIKRVDDRLVKLVKVGE